MPATSPTRYALGRNTYVTVRPFIPLGIGGMVVGNLKVCVSDGSIDLTTDITEIPNNCNSGWKTKLAGNKSGSLSFTGYVASGVTAPPDPMYSPMNWIGQEVGANVIAYDSNGDDRGEALRITTFGVVSSARFSIDANDAVKCEIAIELNGISETSFSGLANSSGL